MKKYFYLFVLALLPMMFTACGDDEENITPQNQESGNPDNPDNPIPPVVENIVVEVDENGNANDGHSFTKIDDTNFYINGIKYTVSQGDLVVSGYDWANFRGVANIITTLKYDGRTMNVTGIKADAFRNCTVLTSLSIPENVTSIGDYAFGGCSGLTSVTIPNSVTSIGDYAFGGCSGLKSVIIGNGVTSIGDYAFNSCRGLKSVIIGNGVTSIGEKAFSSCSALSSIIVKEGNTKYDSREGCNAIIETAKNTLIQGCNNTTIPNNVSKIGSYAFYGCGGLTSITIPNSVTTIDYYAFGACGGLTSITIPDGVTRIAYATFHGCNNMTSVTISKSVTEIDGLAFSGCSKLSSVTCYARNTPSVSSTSLGFYISTATLHVPATSVNAYKYAEYWKDFGSIVAIE